MKNCVQCCSFCVHSENCPNKVYEVLKRLGQYKLPIWAWYSISLLAGRSGDRIPMGTRLCALVQTGPGAHSASYTTGAGSLSGVKWPGRGVDHSLPSSAEVKVSVELDLYSPSRPALPDLS
jgi:hypothetical protein